MIFNKKCNHILVSMQLLIVKLLNSHIVDFKALRMIDLIAKQTNL